MNDEYRSLIEGYLDETLTPDQQESLSRWIQSNPIHARQFAHEAMLHDHLRNTLIMEELSNGVHRTDDPPVDRPSRLATMPIWRAAAGGMVLAACLAVLWFGFPTPVASAAIRELDRIIVRNAQTKDRTYRIIVEELSTPERRGKRPPRPEENRPPKPPLDGATLHVRSGNRFVLLRTTVEGNPFITGSNGVESWAVQARGPVRVSSDIHHFDRDLPGHETSVPLTNLHDGLERLRKSYRLEFSMLGPEEHTEAYGEAARLLVAVKKPKERGPQRVEIVYNATTGQIIRMRFVQMPYGPDRLDLRLSLLSEDPLPDEFFEHKSHHGADRTIERD